MYVLDTDILIDVLRGHQPAINWVTNLKEIPSVSGFVVMELIQNAQNKQKVNQVLKLIAPLPIIWLRGCLRSPRCHSECSEAQRRILV